MAEDEQQIRDTYLSPNDMRQWAQREIREATKALELRVRDVTDLVAEYSAGEITPKQADDLHSRYYQRWGESLPGITVGPDTTDERILQALDERNRAPDHRLRIKAGGKHGREFP